MRTLVNRNKLECVDLYIGMEVVYSDDYHDGWYYAYIEGREDFEEYRKIAVWEGKLIGLTTAGGIVTVATCGVSFKQINIDNLASPVYVEDDDD